MSKLKPTYKMPFRRRKEGKTDYRKRLVLLKSEKPRLVVRKSLKYITAQLVEYSEAGDKTIASTNSKQLVGLGWKFACDNTPAAYLTGLLIAKKAEKAGRKITEAVLDAGLYPSTKGSRIYAVAKGARDAGLDIAVDESVLPSDERIIGSHIAKANAERFKDLPAEFEKMKEIILGKILGKETKETKAVKEKKEKPKPEKK